MVFANGSDLIISPIAGHLSIQFPQLENSYAQDPISLGTEMLKATKGS